MTMIALPKRKKRSKSGTKPMGAALRQFQLALRDPFSPDALGVRVIDSVCYPTTVSHLRFKATCTTTATGTFQAVLLPFLHANSILAAGTMTGNPGVYAYNTSVSYVALPNALKTFYTSYRVVAWGVRIILTDSNQNARGTYTLAPVMLAGKVPGPAALGLTAANNAAIMAAFGVPTPSEAIASMPGAVAVNAQDLMTRGEMLARGLTYSPTAFDMKAVTNDGVVWSGGTKHFHQSPAIWDSATSVTSIVEQTTVNQGQGQLAYLLSVANAPASTAEFQLEFIYHIEGVPQPSSGVVMTSTPSPAGSTAVLERVLAAMTSAGDYFAMGTNVADRLGQLGTQMYRFRNAGRQLLR